MYILAIETTGPIASVALANEKGELWERTADETLSHLQKLIPATEALLEERVLKIDDVSYVAVSRGPGSFTGIRIGMATAKALAQALGLPVFSVPTLKAFAYNLPGFSGLICPIFDARRDQVYGGIYRWQEGKLLQVVSDGAYDVPEFVSLGEAARRETGQELMLFGDGIGRYGSFFEGALLAPEERRFQRASSVAQLALELWKEGRWEDYSQLKPVYLRKAEAERKLEAGRK